jgi:tRNA G18 (ribose-2'-O)-methylase SpoU
VDQDATEGEETEFVDKNLIEVGVGPWEGDTPVGAQWDSDLLANGDRRNVIDKYRYWSLEAIVADLDTKRHPMHIAIENLGHDFNIGTIVRTANAFLVNEVHIVGKKRWNRRGAMVTDRYQHVHHHESAEVFVEWAKLQNIPVIGIDNMQGSVKLERFAFPQRCVLVVGQEGSGLSEPMRAGCDSLVEISQFGSTRSINVGAAAAIAMHEWVRQWAV